MAAQKPLKKFRVRAHVTVSVYAEIEATSLRVAEKMVKEAGGNGLPDAFSWKGEDWVSPVETEFVEEIGADGKTETERRELEDAHNEQKRIFG